jgi:hypothetical protein
VANSTRRKPATKPKKPYRDFPLSFHPSGRLCKKINGDLHYFGRWAVVKEGVLTTVDNLADAMAAAVREYDDNRDRLQAGRSRRKKAEGVTVAELCNSFLRVKDARLNSAELSPESFRDYHEVCRLVVAFFGGSTAIAQLDPADFDDFRAWLTKPHTVDGKLKKPHGVHRLAKDIRVTRMLLKHAEDTDLMERSFRKVVGSNFCEPDIKAKRRSARLSKQKHGQKHFDADELRKLIDAADPVMKSMILLGINCGFGQKDVADLQRSNVQGGWIAFPRPKTEIDRRCPLWKETVQALREASEKRFPPRDPADADCVFITRNRNRYVRMTPHEDPAKRSHVDTVGKAFKRLADSVGVNGKRGFYSLRHTFETVAGASKDQVAVDLVMGHSDPSMAANYRHHVGDDRLQTVVDVVRRWLFSENESK